MIRVGRLFEPEITRVAGSTPIVRFTVTCCLCGKTPKSGHYQASKVLPDLSVGNKFKQRGWLIAKTRDADVCPDCLKVEDKNRLAGVFKVKDQAGPVQSAAEIADEAAQKRAEHNRRAWGAIDRLMGKDPLPTKETETELGATTRSPEEVDAFRSIVANDLQEIRAAVELIAEQNGMRTELLKRQNEGHAVHLQIMEKHIDYFGKLVAATERNNALMDQLIRAIAINTSEVAGIPQTVASGCRDVVAAIRDHADSIVPALAKVPEAIHEQRAEPAPAQPVEPAEDLVPSPAPEVTPRLRRKGASVSVYSCLNRRHGGYYTAISIPRKTWEEVGFTEDDRYTIEIDDDMKITVARATEGGIKPRRIGRDVVVLQTTKLGELNVRRLFVQAADGIIRI
jgi:hypothetical protein